VDKTFYLFIFFGGILLIELYEWTREIEWLILYSLGFHFVSLLLYVILAILLCFGVSQLIAGNNEQAVFCLVTASNGLLWFLFSSILFRVTLLIINLQYVGYIRPLLAGFWKQNSTQHSSLPLSMIIGYQASVMYSLNFVFSLYKVFGVVDMGVNADYGIRGLTKVDIHPNFSGFLILFSKVGIFLVSTIHVWSAVQIFIVEQNNKQEKDQEKFSSLQLSLIYLFGVTAHLYFVSTSLGFQILQYYYIHRHAEEEGVAMVVVSALITITFSSFTLLSRFIKIRNTGNNKRF